MAIIKTIDDLEKLKYSCKILMSCFHHITPLVRAGASCGELDKFAYDFITSYDAIPSFLNCDDGGDTPYKYSICVSINEEVAHGIAPMNKIIPNNCILTLDIGANYKGLFSDSAMTYIVGEVPERIKELVEVAKNSMWEGIKILKTGIKLGDIGAQIDTFVQKKGFGNVSDLGGHGIGYKMHEPPFVAHQGKAGTGRRLAENEVICIEPMITEGKKEVKFDRSNSDGWTVRTKDSSWVAQFEHQIIITKNGYEVLTDIPETELLPLPKNLIKDF